MKIFRSIILKLFALCILALGVFIILGVANIVDINGLVSKFLALTSENVLITIGVSAVVSILAVIGLFADFDSKDDMKSGIAIKRENGNVYIAKETFESIVLNVVRSFASLKNFKAVVSIEEDGVKANIYTYVLADTVVPTITSKLQENIKDAVLKQTTVEIKEVNVKVKGVYNQAEKNQTQTQGQTITVSTSVNSDSSPEE